MGHERFYADENLALSRAGLADAELWLSGEAASPVEDIETRLLPAALADVRLHRDSGMKLPGRELRA